MPQKVEQRAYHGKIDPEDMARTLVMRFSHGETRAQWMRGEAGRAVVQIKSQRIESNDPNTAVTVHIAPIETGVTVAVSEQKWLSVAADLAKTGLLTWLNPFSLIRELDDVARNVRWLTLRREIWKAVDEYCQSRGSGRGAAPLLKNVICTYCGTPNPLGESTTCTGCRAPLGEVQPLVCSSCGFLNGADARVCANCGTAFSQRR